MRAFRKVRVFQSRASGHGAPAASFFAPHLFAAALEARAASRERQIARYLSELHSPQKPEATPAPRLRIVPRGGDDR